MTDKALAERLKRLVYADILAQGSSNFQYRGLGDRVFAMVFRRIYGEEIERVGVEEIDADFKHELASLRGNSRSRRETSPSIGFVTVVLDSQDLATVPAEPPIGPFAFIRKARFYVDHETSVEIDLHAAHKDNDGTDLMIEVKDWEKEPSEDVTHRFIEVKAALSGHLKRKTAFLFYSESGLSEESVDDVWRDSALLTSLMGARAYPCHPCLPAPPHAG